MFKMILCLVFSVSLLAAHDFPLINVYGIEGTQASLPRGKTDLVFVGFDIGAKESLHSWQTALSGHHVLPNGVGCLAVPVLPKYFSENFVREIIVSWLKKRITSRFHACVWMLFSDDAFQQFGIPQEDHVSTTLYVFLVGKNGKILWQATGQPTQERLQTIKALAQADLLSGCLHK
jgi:hypothetical protein